MNVPGDANGADRLGWGHRLLETPVDVVFRQDRVELNTSLRTAFLAGAEQLSRVAHGRGLRNEELHSVMREYPDDMSSERWRILLSSAERFERLRCTTP